MSRFDALDGLRTWMAWLVVASHFPSHAKLIVLNDRWKILEDMGGPAVDTFIVISGFVITHLLLTRSEPYSAYIVRRFMRLFPTYLVCTILSVSVAVAVGNFVVPLNLPWQIAAHATMLHGIFPNEILMKSPYEFLPPGWSVSLEWQFYLVAPLIIAFCRSSRGALIVIIGALLCAMLYYRIGWHWKSPSALLGAFPLFLIGIACRFMAPRLMGTVKYPAAIGLAGLGLGFWVGKPGLGFWMLSFAFLVSERNTMSRGDRAFRRVMHALLESRPIQWLAQRSFVTYLVHWSVMLALTAAGRKLGQSGLGLAGFLLFTFPVTVIAQEVIYRAVDLPGQRLGRSWARRLGEPPIIEVHVQRP
jgi:peptidoglycan/LPS O-acetylase OafA/YrhL